MGSRLGEPRSRHHYRPSRRQWVLEKGPTMRSQFLKAVHIWPRLISLYFAVGTCLTESKTRSNVKLGRYASCYSRGGFPSRLSEDRPSYRDVEDHISYWLVIPRTRRGPVSGLWFEGMELSLGIDPVRSSRASLAHGI